MTWCHLYCMFTYIYSFLIEKEICDCRNLSVKLPCIYMCLSFGNLFIFSLNVFSFFSYFRVIHTLVLSLSMWSHRCLKQIYNHHNWISLHLLGMFCKKWWRWKFFRGRWNYGSRGRLQGDKQWHTNTPRLKTW